MSPVIPSNDRAGRPTEKKAAAKRVAAADSAKGDQVTFHTLDEREGRANLVHLTRHAATFSAHGLESDLRTSEVLNHFKIVSNHRVLYFGRAVVSQLIRTGEGMLCEAKLGELGSETAFFLPPADSPADLQAYDGFFRNWQKNYRITDEFKVLVADVESYLTGVRHWLEEIEFGLKGSADPPAREREILDDIAPRIIAAFNGRHERFEEIIAALPADARGVHQEFVRRHWHRLFLGSPFGHRTFHKPNGYAGDYEMMNMIHRNRPEGGSLFDRCIHLLLVSQWPARSVRNRIAHLGENLTNETARAVRAGKTARILNIGCGPAREVQDFLRASHLSDHAEFTLVDFNEETLTHAAGKLLELKREFSRRTPVRTQQISVFELLRRSQRDTAAAEKFDLIYCAGLFDYLAAETCRALLELWFDSLAPGGLLLVANMHDTKPFRHFIEFILDWQLIYRDSAEIFSLVPERCRATTRVIAEPTAVNLFLHIRKPD